MNVRAHPRLSDEPDLARLKRAERQLRAEPQAALSEFNVLAQQGSVLSMIFIGSIYQKGIGVGVDFDKAEKWYRSAADRGSLRGHYFLGRLYLKKKQYDDAAAAFDYAASERYVPALHFLGFMYLKGLSVARNPEWGEHLLRRAAAAGSVSARATLAHHLIRSRSGVRKTLLGIGLLMQSIMQFFCVIFKEGPRSDRFQ